MNYLSLYDDAFSECSLKKSTARLGLTPASRNACWHLYQKAVRSPSERLLTIWSMFSNSRDHCNIPRIQILTFILKLVNCHWFDLCSGSDSIGTYAFNSSRCLLQQLQHRCFPSFPFPLWSPSTGVWMGVAFMAWTELQQQQASWGYLVKTWVWMPRMSVLCSELCLVGEVQICLIHAVLTFRVFSGYHIRWPVSPGAVGSICLLPFTAFICLFSLSLALMSFLVVT